jgi:hypothetical protein
MKVTSWKTTVVGAILALIIAIQPLIATGTIDWKQVIIAGLIAVLGYVAKDRDVTGGTKQLGTPTKKLLMILCLVAIPMAGMSQSLFKPVPKDLFTVRHLSAPPGAAIVPVQHKWVPRLNTGIMGVSWELKKGTKPVPFEAIGFGLALLQYKEVNGEPFNVWGINALFLTSTNHTAIGFGLYGLYNTNQIGLVNLGIHYDAGVKSVFIDTGLTYSF